jgi:hypothetical protein
MQYFCIDCRKNFTAYENAAEHRDSYGHFVSGEVSPALPIEVKEGGEDDKPSADSK